MNKKKEDTKINPHSHIKCGNCGIKGHVYSNCKLPILSYGIILFTFLDEQPKILLVQRKDSLTYIEYIRGKYNINDKKDKYPLNSIKKPSRPFGSYRLLSRHFISRISFFK